MYLLDEEDVNVQSENILFDSTNPIEPNQIDQIHEVNERSQSVKNVEIVDR